ncbi:ATPase involved in DNA repair [Serratia proteamaculans]|uniref:AAA family ATPase n=1 Tax=Serratia proteamaculans TaxID=28151 RepID=UPI002178DB2C|nr:AAA family ATPase [Serratia proteamaculans]CAI0838066.1 ATPase involved in DNA repair [Serratia proteamaculans]
MKIKKVEIEAFRAYKYKAEGTFDFTNFGDVPSNFVAIYAPNGFGKSSFYDAVEWAITNHLERLGGEYNKGNYESAAKITKEENESQKILRNKYVDKKIITKVVVSTTRPEPFERTLPNIRSNGRDLRIGDNKQKENEYFRRVILSQDEIDRFLREAKPQERYSKFMESFGGDIEIARKELSVLISDNKAELSTLDKKRELLFEALKQPIDLSVFEHFNSIASELNSLGENIMLPDESFSSQHEHALNANLVSRHHELDMSCQANSRKKEALADRLAKIPEVHIHFSYMAEQEHNRTKLMKGVADSEKYQAMLDSRDRCLKDQQQVHARSARFVEIMESSGIFLQTESRLHEISAKQKILSEERSKNSAKLASIEQTMVELKSELQASDDKTLLFRNTVDNAVPVYSELSIHRPRLGALGQKIADKEITIRLDNAKLIDLNRELKELSTLNITSIFLMAGNISPLLFEQKYIDQLTRCYADLDLIEVHNQSLHATQKALTEQMGLHEKLVATGLDFLSICPSNICPLCSSSHPSIDALLDKVKGQNLLSKLSKENSHKLSLSSKRQSEFREVIQNITRQAVEAQVQQVTSIRTKLNEVVERLVQAEREKSILEAEQKGLEIRIAELESSVWGLSNDELISRAKAEISQLSIKRLSLIKQQTEFATQIDLLNESNKAKDSELHALLSETTSKSNEHAYILIHKYLYENAITSSDLEKHCKLKMNDLEADMLKYKTAGESLTGQCSVLQQEMLKDGTWMDFSQLKSHMEALQLNLARSQSAVTAFYNSLTNIVVARPEDTLDKVKTIIIEAVEDCRLRGQEIDKRLSAVKLLLGLMTSFKPYINRNSVQKELADVEQVLNQRKQVDEILIAERDAVVSDLKTLINNFFYEELINSIYRKIDPHPAFKKVEFIADFNSDKPGLNIVVCDENGGTISPILYFSAAQTNILSLSVFLASALHAKDDEGNPIDVVMIDDPIQSMDSINILSTIDLLRSICLQFNKQVIISTHDENFFGLLQRKIPAQILGSKFLQLGKFGVVEQVEPFLD